MQFFVILGAALQDNKVCRNLDVFWNLPPPPTLSTPCGHVIRCSWAENIATLPAMNPTLFFAPCITVAAN